MRARCVAVLAAAAVAGGCALLDIDEPFAGRYHVADPKDRTQIRITASFPGRWEMRYDGDPYPHGELVAASRSELTHWFGSDAPIKDIRCLATTGKQAHPVVCEVPKDVALRLERKAARISRTGWILVAPSANGLVFGDLARER